VLVHTGQHFDDELSAVFFKEFGLPAPDRQLGIALGSNTSQTSRMLAALEPALAALAPDVVLVYGDTNSTLAGALAGVPCVTIRPSTEWVETVEHGWNVLVDLDAHAALEALQREPPARRPELYGDGHAGERVVQALTLRYA
jgi:UDP-N-acetylglucosamine 2-epimerase